ncbi:MAG TPA: hypothetical protein VHT93_20450 [Pseudolabrys sp.]|jgi:hypothetical protein|nr:hypothetical protein [Pseudolabrys sp.]
MASIPEPTPGLIFRYGYVWLEEYRNGKVDPSKDRPACIVARVAQGSSSFKVADTTIAPGDVIILPITTKPPRAGIFAVELTADEKRLCRLNPDYPSWVIVSEFNADTWPNADLRLIQETNRFDYGMARPGLLRRIGEKFTEARRANMVLGVKR